MKKIPLTQNKFALIDDCDYDLVNQYKWHVGKMGYVYYASTAPHRGERIYMHRLIMGEPDNTVDHVNGNGLDNRRSNLRVADMSQQNSNKRMQKNNKSGYRGVSFEVGIGKWYAQIQVRGKKINLGKYKDKKSAALAYNKAAKKYFGEFARLNEV